MLDTTLKRVTIKIPAYIQEYYKALGEKYSVPYSNYMAMVLTQIYEKDKDKQLVEELNNTFKTLSSMSDGSVSSEQMLLQMQDILSQVKQLEK